MKDQGYKTKIAYLVNSFPGFSETFILNEMEALEGLDFNICCFSLSAHHASPIHRLAKKWIARTYWPTKYFSLFIWLLHLQLASQHPLKYFHYITHCRDYGGKKHFLMSVYFANIMKKEGITHIHAQFGFCGGAAMLISWMAGTGYSLTLHHADIFYVPPANMAELINRSAFCVTISEFNRKYLIKQWSDVDQSKIIVIRCGIDTDKFLYITRNPESHKQIQLLTVSRLAPIKNVGAVINICRELRDKGYSYKCKIVGDGPEKTTLQEQIHDLNLVDSVVLKGALSQEDLVSVYKESDIFLITSKSEGIPLTIMEAMSTGLPIVAPHITGIPEIIENGVTGYLFDENDLSKATSAIIYLMDNPNLRMQIGDAGREKVIREYNLHFNSSQLAELFDNLVKLGQSYMQLR